MTANDLDLDGPSRPESRATEELDTTGVPVLESSPSPDLNLSNNTTPIQESRSAKYKSLAELVAPAHAKDPNAFFDCVVEVRVSRGDIAAS